MRRFGEFSCAALASCLYLLRYLEHKVAIKTGGSKLREKRTERQQTDQNTNGKLREREASARCGTVITLPLSSLPGLFMFCLANTSKQGFKVA